MQKKVLDPVTRSRLYNACVSGRESNKEYLRSGELSRLAGVSADTLRHYERKGLLAPQRRSANGYREYHESALDRVRLIRSALSVGFTLDELSRVLKLRDRGGAPCQQVRALAEAKLREAEARLIEIRELRDRLLSLLAQWDELIEVSGNGDRAGLLDALAQTDTSSQSHSPLRPAPLNRRRSKKETYK